MSATGVLALLGSATDRGSLRSLEQSGLTVVALSPTLRRIQGAMTPEVGVVLIDGDSDEAAAAASWARTSRAQIVVITRRDIAAVSNAVGISRRQIVQLRHGDTVADAVLAAMGRPSSSAASGEPSADRPVRTTTIKKPDTAGEPAAPTPRQPYARARNVVMLGCSTGGPQALAKLLPMIPDAVDSPIVICQHMPETFTGVLAKSLTRFTDRTVVEVIEPTTMQKRHVYLAHGDQHLVVTNPTGRLEAIDGPKVHNCRPSVNVLFDSAAEYLGGRVVGVVLTGMGGDGAEGAAAMVAAGAHMIVQDQATSVVWGMPGAVVAAGVPTEVLPLGDIGARLGELLVKSELLGAGA